MKFTPAISIVMPVYNYGHLIKYSIDSVLDQAMSDFELIVVNDGSTDSSSEIAHSYFDKRVKVMDLPVNQGCYPARNAGMKAASGKYICVMDADDLCMPERLEKQYQFMEENAGIGLIGGAYKIWDSNQIVFRESDYETIKVLLLQHCYLHHPTCMIRALLVKKNDLYYNESYKFASDHDWQVRASSLFPVSNLNVPVLLYRKHDRQISATKQNTQFSFANQIRLSQLYFFGIEPTETEKALHLAFINGLANKSFGITMINRWVDKLLEANKITQYYSQNRLQNCLQAHQNDYIFRMRHI
jgi:glycosyltransferase involved in cell wall biosynthesis